MGWYRRSCKRDKESIAVNIKHELNLYLFSAQNLKDVRSCFGGNIRTYAVTWVEPNHKLRTSVDDFNGQNPYWNTFITLSLDAELLEKETAAVTIDIYCHGCLWDKRVGTVRVLLSDLIKAQKFLTGVCLTFVVMRPSGRRQGQLNLGIPPSSYQFVDSCRKEIQPQYSQKNPLSDS